jgi:Transglycosylase-like domain/LysM domain
MPRHARHILLLLAALAAGLLILVFIVPASPVRAATAASVILQRIPAIATPAAPSAAPARPGALARIYTVRPGDTLSGISGRAFGNPGDWPRFYAANRKVIGGNPDLIEPGQALALRLAATGAVLVTAKAPAPEPSGSGRTWGVTRGYPNYCGDGDGDGWDVACQQQQPQTVQTASDPAPAQQAASSSGGNVNPGSYSGFQACVISRESGGQSQVMNSTGHYGLYQFSASTWAAYGGNPASFGHASVAEQNAVFANAMAQGGQSNWSPYDGC